MPVVAPVFRVMEVSARMLPSKLVFVPSTAELPVCQKMRQGCALPMSKTLLLLAVVSVLPILKIKTLLGLPCPFRVS